MSRDGANVYTLPEAPFNNGTVANAPAMNNNLSDIAAALTDSVCRSTETTPLSRALLDDANAAAAQSTLGLYVGATGGSATAITATPGTALTSYATGLTISARITTAGGVQPTLNVSGLGAKKVYVATGAGIAQATTGDLPAGDMPTFRYDAALDGGAGGWIVVGAPGWRTLETRTVSGVSQTDFLLPVAFSAFRLQVINFIPSANGTPLTARFSSDSGATFLSTTSYWSFYQEIVGGVAGAAENGSQTSITLGPNQQNAAATSGQATWTIIPGSASVSARIFGLSAGANATPAYVLGNYGGAWNGTAALMNAIRLRVNSGTFSGTFVLEGLR